jgi:hypothetical protein
VDDLIFTENNPKMFRDFKQAMIKELEMMNIGIMSYCLRILKRSLQRRFSRNSK